MVHLAVIGRTVEQREVQLARRQRAVFDDHLVDDPLPAACAYSLQRSPSSRPSLRRTAVNRSLGVTGTPCSANTLQYPGY